MCDECAILREHYPRDPEVRLVRGNKKPVDVVVAV